MTLVFDTETTGKADFRAGPDAPHQPHLVQMGAILFDGEMVVRGELNAIIKPDGWVIPREASDIHGITQEMALAIGLPMTDVMRVFYRMAVMANVVVCHNADFDTLIVDSVMHRLAPTRPKWIAEGVLIFCTMKHTTDICKLPGRQGFKWPTLQEAHKFCFGVEFDGAHDAMADVRACAAVYQWILKNVTPPII